MGGTFSYLMGRLLWVPPILFVVTFATFTLARLGPGDPVRISAGQFRDPEAFERIRIARGLDKPIYEQYFIYMKGVLTEGDLGESFKFQDISINEILFPAMWRSFQYNVISLPIILIVGIGVGAFAARRQGTWVDPISISSLLLLQSIPSLILLPFLLLIFGLELGILPVSGWPRNCPVWLGFLGDDYACIGVLSKEAILPLVVLTLPAFAIWARFTRAFVLEVMREDYIRTARAKGLSEMTIMTRHVLRNAMLPLSTMVTFAFIGLLEGAFFIENISGIPGVGRLAFDSVGSRDYDMIMAITIIGATLFVLASIFIDIIYTFLDPRVRYGSRSR